ncbi:MAG: hypothetical protein ACI910_002087 [Oleispira sp.]|jgi:hypothetical protein
MNRRILRNVILSTLACSASLMSIDSLAADSEYEQWLQQTQTEFQHYLDENDKAFIGFLNKKWQEVEVEKTVTRDPAPKPLAIPIAKPIVIINDTDLDRQDTTKSEKKIIKPIIIKPIDIIKPPTVDKKPVAEKKPIVKKDFNLRNAQFDFFGENIIIEYHKSFKQIFRDSISNKSIASYWTLLATQPHKAIIEQLSEASKKLQLNDWGIALLFDQFARELQGSNQRNQSSRQLTSWFLLVKAGFNARIAYNQQLFLLMPSKQPLFSTTYFTIDNQRYYSVSLNEKAMKPGKVFTYSGKHLDGQRNLDFSEPNKFVANQHQEKRDLSFSYNGEKFDINVSYPKGMVNYFKTFPQLDLKNYFLAGMPQETAYSLLSQLKPIIEGQTEIEAVNRLLRFVQTAFKYKTDDDQFQQENYLFPLETLYYPYSDCEDRAALFAWLTKSLLTLDVVIVDFPGHIATAIEFSKPVQGDSWQLNGKRYTVADPTYVNANVGMTMPQYKNKAPTLIAF